MSLIIKRVVLAVLVCITLSALSLAQADSSLAGKKLIEFGTFFPDPSFIRQNIDEMEKIPFDGVAIETGKAWKMWSRTRLNPGDLQPAIEDLKATKFGRFTDNFIYMVTFFPTKQDEMGFFDPDWSSIAYNAACLARVAKESGCKGLLIDPEDYAPAGIWSYTGSRVNTGHSYEEYVTKARERGREFIRAISKEYPDITILILHGYEISASHSEEYPLLRHFLDGICEAAEPGMVLVDGYEKSYGYVSPKLFKDGRKEILTEGKAKSSSPSAYEQHVRMGFGIWLDYGREICDSPEVFRAALSNAMAKSDKYVWVYSERVRWWDPICSRPASVPDPYIKALGLARKGPGPGKHPAEREFPPAKATKISGHDDAETFAEMKKTMTEVFDFPKDGWKLKYDESKSGLEMWNGAKLDDSKWLPVSIGKFWDEMYGKHEGYGWYRLKFTAPAKTDGKQIFLIVGAADESAWVWLNSWKVGSHADDDYEESWQQAFALDVTPYIRPGQENDLAIRVLNREGAGGLWKSIKLMEK